MARAAEAEVVGEGERDGAEEGMGARTTLLRHPYSSPLRSTDRPQVGRSVASLCALRVEAILPCFLLCPIGEGERYSVCTTACPDTSPFPALSASLILDSRGKK